MNPSKEQELQIDNYLRKLRECLPDMSVADREEIVREISVHIRESAQEANSSIEEILKRLGSAENLASQYGHDLLIRHASRSISPVLILRATLELAKRGLEGTVLFLGALLGYGLGGGLVLTAILKPIFPRQTGLWIGPGVFDFGIHEPRYSDPVHEVLGWWYIPLALCLGCFFLWLTTYGIRRFLRRSKQRGPLFARGQMGVSTNAGVSILLTSLLVAVVCFGNATPSFQKTHFSSMTGDRVAAPSDVSQQLQVQIHITRDAGGGLHVQFVFSRRSERGCRPGRQDGDCEHSTRTAEAGESSADVGAAAERTL